MALDPNLILADALGTPVNRTFQMVGPVKGGTLRLDSSTTLGAPRQLTILHQTIGNGKLPTGDRHLTQWLHRVIGVDGLPYDLVVNQTVLMPRSTITRAQLNDVLKFNSTFWTNSGYVDNMLINAS